MRSEPIPTLKGAGSRIRRMIVKLDTQACRLDQVTAPLSASRPLDLQPGPGPRPTRVETAGNGLLPPGEGRQGPDRPASHARSSPACCTRPDTPSPTAAAPGDIPRRYTADIGLLAEVDATYLSGPATPQLCVRALAAVRRPPPSASAISRTPLQPAPLDQINAAAGMPVADAPRALVHRLRTARALRIIPAARSIPCTKPGDLDGIKGLYHLNRGHPFQFVGSSSASTRPPRPRPRSPAPGVSTSTCPGFHTDNGSELHSPPGCKPWPHRRAK